MIPLVYSFTYATILLRWLSCERGCLIAWVWRSHHHRFTTVIMILHICLPIRIYLMKHIYEHLKQRPSATEHSSRKPITFS